jgi:acyl-CoA reductase-like NAD-dependent aldehyde dehydrogenase
MTVQRTISPVDGSVYVERELAGPGQIEEALERAVHAFQAWRKVPVGARAAILTRFCAAFEARRDAIANELSWQMGRPIRYAPNEVRGTLERARHMIEIGPDAIADIDVGRKAGFTRFLRREPLGVVLTVAAWNYPYLIAVNSVVPAILAGNVVLLKHSAQTPLCAERFAECFREAGLPEGVFQVLHMDHDDTDRVIAIHASISWHSPDRWRAVTRCSAPRPNDSSAPGSSSGAAMPPTCATMPTSRTPSRTWSTGRISTRDRVAAEYSASTCTSASTRISSRDG